MKQLIRLGIGGTRRESTVGDRRGLFALDGFCKTQKGETTNLERDGVANLETCRKVRVGPFHEAVVCWVELVRCQHRM